METLHDYIKWMKNIDFRSVGLTEPDAVVLTTLTYFDYAPLFATGAKTVYLKDMRSRLESGDVKPFITGRDTGALELLRDAANSSRYGELRIVDFVDEFRNDPPFQFSALTFECPGAFRFIAFRGTDSTIAGWKEDFMISFTETEAQKAALCYAENHIDPETVNYISGHSKGGNEALYAACYLSRDLFSAVKRVFLLDSPGCAKEVLDPRLVREIDRKTTRIIPEFDLVGKLFEPEITDTKIVRSSEQLVMQHAPNSWLVDHGELDTVPKCAEASLWITHLVTDWIEELPMEERPVFTDELFSALTADGAKDLAELNVDSLQQTVVKLRGLSPSTVKNIASLPKKVFFDDTLDNVSESQTKTLWERFLAADWLTSLLTLLTGVAVFFLSDNLLPVVSLVLSIAVALFQIVLTVRRLIKNKWKLDALKERFYITLATVAFVVILLVKENAFFFLGSLIFGLVFLISSYFAGARAFRKTLTKFIRIVSGIECILFLILGVSFLLIPSNTVSAYAVSIAILLVADGLTRLLYAIARRIASAKRKKEPRASGEDKPDIA